MYGQDFKAKTPAEHMSHLEEPRRSEIKKIHEFIQKSAPSLKPFILAGTIGYGKYHYKYPSGREGEWYKIGLASNKNYISIYLCALEDGEYIAEKNKKKLPKASIGKSCIRYRKFEDIEFDELGKLIKQTEKLPALGES